MERNLQNPKIHFLTRNKGAVFHQIDAERNFKRGLFLARIIAPPKLKAINTL